jgi:predicted ArsR family transcriptional regulator
MSEPCDLSCTAKLVRVVLDNCGPLSASEVAAEARIDADAARAALEELAAADRAESVCGVCTTREDVYELRDSSSPESSSA